MIDPHTVPIEADLSRADVVLLHKLCANRNVVEFGAGGSTLLLAQVASCLESYEPDPKWVECVTARLVAMKGTCGTRVVALPNATPPADLPPADVYFIDGLRHARPWWVRAVIERRLARVIALHDSRRSETGYGFLFETPCVLMLDRIVPHAGQSNITLFILRAQPVVWENWNLTEPENRLPHLHKQ